MNIHIETERLILRPILESDVEGMFALDSDPLVHKYLGNKPIKTREESLRMIQSIQAQYKSNGIGRWAVINKQDQAFMGWTGLKLNTEEELNGFSNFYDIGYRFIKKYWGQGYATESAKPALEYGFNTMKLPCIYGITEIENQASHSVLLKLGLDFVENFHSEKEKLELRWYKIEKP